jgi:hypothetical protein
MACHACADRRRNALQAIELRASEAPLRGDAVEIDVEAGFIDPDRSRDLVDDAGIPKSLSGKINLDCIAFGA